MGENITVSSVVVAKKEQLSTDLGGEAVILGMESGQYYSLNDVGTRIWDLVQGPTTVINLRDTIVGEYDVEFERCEQDILEVLEDMASEGLIEVKVGSPL